MVFRYGCRFLFAVFAAAVAGDAQAEGAGRTNAISRITQVDTTHVAGSCTPGTPCDDCDACTTGDVFNAQCECIGTPLTCDDGDICTEDHCTNGDCTHIPMPDFDGDGHCDRFDACPSLFGQPGDPCDDGDPCTDGEIVMPWCVCGPGFSMDCDDGDLCTEDYCDGGICIHLAETDFDGDGECDWSDNCPDLAGQIGDPCDDGDPCTEGEAIEPGCVCGFGLLMDCDDNDLCTEDYCDGGICIHLPETDFDGDGVCDWSDNCPTLAGRIGDPCDDGDPCTEGEAIAPGCVCGFGLPMDCDDNELCTEDYCDEGICIHLPETDFDGDGICDWSDNCPDLPGRIGDPCDDGNPCTEGESIEPGCTCGFGLPMDCDDNDLCTEDYCDGGICFHLPETDFDGDGECDWSDNCPDLPGQVGDPCDDGDPCTEGEAITQWCQCGMGLPLDCDDGDPCTMDLCSGGACGHVPFPDTDEDGVCDLLDPCPSLPGVLPGSDCDDGDPCTLFDVIVSDCFCRGLPLFCDDGNPCTDDRCDGGTCVFLPYPDFDGDGLCDNLDPCPLVTGGPGDGCDDGNACTWFDHVTADCQCHGQPSFCEDDDPCTFNLCDPMVGCTFPLRPDTDEDGICDAMDDCPLVSGIQGSPCDDGLACTASDELNANCRCTGTAVICDDLDPCTLDGCLEPGGCTYLVIPDSDGDSVCDAVEWCPGCDDGDPCTYDFCDEEGDCVHSAVPDPDGDGICPDGCPFVPGSYGSPCDDGNACTTADVIGAFCQCAGTPEACADEDPCTADGCLATTGCQHVTGPDNDGDGVCDAQDSCPYLSGAVGDVCDDGIACTVGDHIAINCVCLGFPTSCDDSDPCTFNYCGIGGCVPVAIPDTDGDFFCDAIDNCPITPGRSGDPCDDGDPCTIADVIDAHCTCKGSPMDCDDQDSCTVDIPCMGGVCAHEPFPDTDADGICDAIDGCPFTPGEVGDICNDGDPCTTDDRLEQDCICRGVDINCDDMDPCTIDMPCTGGDCVYAPFPDTDGDGICDAMDTCPFLTGMANGPCDDGDPCTQVDTIDPQCQCVGSPIDCDDMDLCTIDMPCSGGDCVHTPFPDTDEDGDCDATDSCPFIAGLAGGPCDDGDPCTLGDTIDPQCQCVGTPIDCDDMDPCTIDMPCTGGECVHAPFPDTDEDGDCDATDSCPFLAGAAGGPCDDGDPCTLGDTIDQQCQCVGTPIDCDDMDLCTIDMPCTGGECVHAPFPDTDGDGTCDATDTCPYLVGLANGPCDDGDPCTEGDTIDPQCQCVGSPINCDDMDPCTIDLPCIGGECLHAPFPDSDDDGLCDAWDQCPYIDGEPGSTCDDESSCTSGDVVNDDCQCKGTWTDCDDGDPCTLDQCSVESCCVHIAMADSDGDGLCDDLDDCPTTPGTIGSPCDDGDPVTSGDVVNAACTCVGSCTGTASILTVTTDANGTQTEWHIMYTGTNTPVCSGAGLASNSTITLGCCLPGGCYDLVITDSFGDGIVGGGYVLRDDHGQRIIDNAGNGAGFTTLSLSPLGFCVPIGTDALQAGSCDMESAMLSTALHAELNPAVTAQYGVHNANSGYQFWVTNPHGAYSRRLLLTHAAPGPGAPSGTPAAQKASYFLLSTMSNSAPYIPRGILLNARVRSVVNGTYAAFGPACRLIIPVPPCVTTQLTTLAAPVISCGATGLGLSSTIWAGNVPGATGYQFEFTKPGYTRRILSATRSQALSFVTSPLQLNNCYQVRVRVSFDNSSTYCPFGPYCTITLGTASCTAGMALGADPGGAGASRGPHLALWPNPGDGGQMGLSLTGFDVRLTSVDMDLADAGGRRVFARKIQVEGGSLNTTITFAHQLAPGVYAVGLQAGEQRVVGRLVIQR